MRRCPICENELTQGPVCDTCGFDLSCDYEGRRTLCSVLPKSAQPVSVGAARWRQRQQTQQQQQTQPWQPQQTQPWQQQQTQPWQSQRTQPWQPQQTQARQTQTVTSAPGALVCPKCGGQHFYFMVNELQFVYAAMCMDCGTKVPTMGPKNGMGGSPPSAEPQSPTDHCCPCCVGSGINTCFTEFAGTEGNYRYYISKELCKLCGGTGVVSQPVCLDYENKLMQTEYLRPVSRNFSCKYCHGSGVVVSGQTSQLPAITFRSGLRMQPCPACEGKEIREDVPYMRKRGIATFLCLFPYTWVFAAHCFYLKKKSRGIVELIMLWGGAMLAQAGVPLILVWLFLWIQDIIRIRKMPKFFDVN